MSYTLTLQPTILREEFPGALEAVTFVVQHGPAQIKMWTINDGLLPERFLAFCDRDQAVQFLAALSRGETVQLPDPVTRTQLLQLGFAASELALLNTP